MSDDVNEYIREVAGEDFSAKDFRTWIGTVECIAALAEPESEPANVKQNVAAALARVAARLGNTPAVCRKAYVYPAVIETYTRLGSLACRNGKAPATVARRAAALSREERLALRFVQRWERGQSERTRATSARYRASRRRSCRS